MALSITKKKYIYWSISFVSLTAILFSIYFHLGGFEEIKAGKSGSSNYSIAGKWIKGKGVRKEERKVFYELKQSIEKEDLKGILCMIDFKNDTLDNHEVVHFLGVILENEVTALSSDLEVIEIGASTTYKASLTMHPLVMPGTRKVESKLIEMAKPYGDKLQPLTIEMFFSDNSVMVEMFAF